MSDYNIGNIYAELAMDISNLEVSKKKAIKELGNLRDEGERILKEAGGKMTEAMKIRLDEIEKNKSEILKNLNDLNKQIRDKANPVKEEIGAQIENVFMKPLKAFASSSIDTFTQFQQSMQNTFSVMGASSSDMQLLEETAKKMGETTRFSASEASKALYSLGSAGQSASEAVNSLQGVLRLAGATGSELAYTSETIASTLSQFNLEASKASHIADVYAKAISKSQASMTKLSYSMKYVGPVASGLGISLETTTAALMQLYNTGYGGEQAGTYLKQAFQKLASGTNDLKAKLQELGISYEDVNPQTRNFADIINTLKEKNIGVTESIAIFGETAGGAMAKLIEEGGGAISTMEGLLKSSEGAAAEMLEIQNASFANTKAELQSAMQAVQITTGSILEPALNILAKGFTEILQSVNSLPLGIQTFITTMLTASTAIVPFLTMPALIQKIQGAMKVLNNTMLHNPIFLSGVGLAALASIAYSYYQHSKAVNERMIQEATKGAEDIKEIYKKAHEAGEKGRNIQGLLSQYETLKDKTNKTKEEQEAYNSTLQKLTELVPGVVTKIDETGNAYIENIEKIKHASREQLLLEQQQLQKSKVMLEMRARIAETVVTNKDNEIKNIDENITKEEQNVAKTTQLFEEYKKLKNDLKKAKGEAKKEAQEAFNTFLWKQENRLNTNFEYSVEITQDVYNKYEDNFLNNTSSRFNKLNKLLDKKEELTKIKEDAEKTIQELEVLKKQEKEVTKLLTAPEEKKEAAKLKSKDEILKAYRDKRIATYEKLKEDQIRKKKQIDLLAEEEKLLRADLEILMDMKPSEIAEGEIFDIEDKGIKRIHARIDEIQKIKAKEKKLQETNTKEDQKEEQKPLTFLEEVEKEYQEKKQKLQETLEHIKTIRAELDSLKADGENNEEKKEAIKYYEDFTQKLEGQAQNLSTELGKDFVLLGDIDSKIGEMENKDTNSFKAKFKAIRDAKIAVIDSINKAQAQGNIDEKTAQDKINKINNVALKSTITVGAELAKTILSVGNTFTDMILGAMEKGQLSVSDSLNIASQIGNEIGNLVGDPMTKSILGAVTLATSLLGKIFGFDEKTKKENEQRITKAFEEEVKKRREIAKTLTDGLAEGYTKQLGSIQRGFGDINNLFADMNEKVKQNKAKEVLKNIGDTVAETYELTKKVKQKGWYQYQDYFGNWIWAYDEHMEDVTETLEKTVNELIKEYNEAVEKGDEKLQKKTKRLIEKAINKKLKKEGINTEELNSFHNYMQGLENAFVDAVKAKDFEKLRLAMREKIREAMWAKLQQSLILSKLKPLFTELENAGETQKEAKLEKIMKESETIAKELDKYSQKMFGELGGVSSELEEHKKAWIGLKTSITEALSSSLEESAYNADWASFKKAFAGEMKKAIIRATVQSMGLKTGIDKIIKDIMKDGKITEEEINNSIEKLQGYFDNLEGKLAPLAKITRALEGGVEVNSKHQGTIIQQLSGADRDFFAEEFRKNFASMKDSFKSAMIDLKEIHQAQITVSQATLTVNDIYINAQNPLDLRELITEIIEQARQAG